MNNNAWQTPFGKLLVVSSILAAIAGFAVVTAAKDSFSGAMEDSSANEMMLSNELAPDDPSAAEQLDSTADQLDAQAQALESELAGDPNADSSSTEEQAVDQETTEHASEPEGVMQ